MKKIGPEFVMRVSMVLGIALIVTGAVFVSQVQTVSAQQEMVTLCHADGQSGTTKFSTITVAYPAAYGQAGHFNEDGTPTAGHEDDYLGPCLVEEDPTATPVSPTATPVVPTATPVIPTVTPTTPIVGGDPTQVPTLGVPVTGSEILIPVTGADLTGGAKDFNKGKFLMSLGFAFLGLGIVSYGISKKQ